MGYRAVTIDIDTTSGVAELRLCRPELLNRFDDVLLGELAPALAELAADPGVRAVVWTSTGKHFSAGGDTDTILAGHDDEAHLMAGVEQGKSLYRAFAGFGKPLVVALHGHAFGVATSLVLTADAIVTTPTAKLVDPHVHLGLVAGDGGAISWPVNLPLVRAKRHLLWGEPLTGQQAYDLGLVSDLVQTPEQVRERAFALAAQVAALPPVAVQLTKATLNAGFAARVEELLDIGFLHEATSNRTADVVEAVAAFKEGRPGIWTGA
ncbi:MAG: enoyl-CoA hydratase/isomerase family protein [Sporichthyaceae bacterium]